MLERLRKLLRPDRGDDAEATSTYRLCRLRHATLHPGATLWTPGSGGGNLGAGAAEALADVGLGGELVVGFQTRAREPVYPRGVLARVEEIAPFPEDWDPEGLGAPQRYRLMGLGRVELDISSVANKRVPTVTATLHPARPEELEQADAELLAQLAGLAAADNHWPDHWLEAFDQLPAAPLGQWATTLGWRLGAEERLELFDHPDRIAARVLSTLDSLHAGLDPTRRREAVRVQALTRRTTIMPERTLAVVSDAAGWALFHPGDLGEGGGPAVTPETVAAHLAMGNLLGVRTAPGRRAIVRFTGGELTGGESAARLGEATFRLFVRHGRLFLGGAALATGNHFDDRAEYADPNQWIDVPNGLFKVVVSAIAGPDGSPEAYVIQLREAEQLEAVPTLSALPDLRGTPKAAATLVSPTANASAAAPTATAPPVAGDAERREPPTDG